jgi:hypothetical protein
LRADPVNGVLLTSPRRMVYCPPVRAPHPFTDVQVKRRSLIEERPPDHRGTSHLVSSSRPPKPSRLSPVTQVER